MKRLISALLFAAFAVTAAGCTATRGNGSPAHNAAANRPAPAPESFAPGACSKMAPHVIELWNMANNLQDRPLTKAERNALMTHQKALSAAMPGASPKVREAARKLVNAAGWNAFTADLQIADQPQLMPLVVQADSALQDACKR
jgi:hypothetical protein